MKNKIIFVLSLLFGLMFLNAGLNKFFNYMPAPDDLPESMLKVVEAFNTIGWLMPLVGIFEIIGGILFIIPKTRALGAIIIFPIMVGILLINTVNMPSGLPLAAVLFVINLWVIYEYREQYSLLIKDKI
ncbi:DoxX family protein [Allomuricauda taeanensis]|jgi:uncharacterized membrane protein YphA (DoxX/SURF4 family)|uniref:DoxX family protein n=1 Tax=Flagellimonas taeanensis TaxID=1005926 RepID=UPI002E7B066F|nr:DoxX family protein [Allomuricauda taeanensis]MEE1961229.1 DoxX family protein [Allomuricauda taeanensis]